MIRLPIGAKHSSSEKIPLLGSSHPINPMRENIELSCKYFKTSHRVFAKATFRRTTA